MYTNKLLLVVAIPASIVLAGEVLAATYSVPVAGSKYFHTSNTGGEVVTEVLSASADGYQTRTKRQRGTDSEEFRLFGIQALSKQLNEGVLPRDLLKAAQIFPLQLGKKVSFDTYGSSGAGRWYRGHTWEVVQEYSVQVGTNTEKVFAIKMLAESPGFFKFDGVCHYAVKYAICMQSEGELFIRGNSDLTGPINAYMTKAIVSGAEVVIPNLKASAAVPASVQASVPNPVAPVAAPTTALSATPVVTPAAQPLTPAAQTASVTTPTPAPVAAPATAPAAAAALQPTVPAAQSTAAEQRLKQAKDLLDKKLITQQQYDEFVSRIMKDM